VNKQDRPTEIELKLAYPAEARQAIEIHPSIADVAAQPTIQHAVYYDTPDLDLKAAGLSLRVRRNDDKFVQTLKQDTGAGGAASSRGEWEWERPDETLDLDAVRVTPAAEFADAKLGPIFTADITRTVRELHLPDGSEIEVALDEGVITSGHAEVPVREMELELKSGRAAALYRLAVALHADVPLRIVAESKAARGYQLKTGHAPTPAKATKPVLNRRITGRAAFRAISEEALAGLTRNQAAARAGDAEGTHQMRISIRKLRAVFVLFEPLLELHAKGQFDAVLRRLGHVLGEARDWDVFCDETLPHAQTDVKEPGWAGLMAKTAERQRRSAYEALRAQLDAPAITGAALGIAAWAEDDYALGHKDLDRRLTEIGPALLDLMANKAEKRGRHLRRLSPEELHKLRKTMKKLRYATEYMGGFYPEKPVKLYVKPIKNLQKLLGGINDSVMAMSMAERLCEGEALDLVPGLGDIAAWAERRRAAALAKLPKAWAAFSEEKRFW